MLIALDIPRHEPIEISPEEMSINASAWTLTKITNKSIFGRNLFIALLGS
jgi:hypothetical protein